MSNALTSYRRTQREIRHHFDEFTRANCPTCPTPCCRQPARILPTDILLAEAAGWRPPRTLAAEDSADRAADAAVRCMDALVAADGVEAGPSNDSGEDEALPCEFLTGSGCSFPSDLRPFGCTTYICRYMYERLDRRELGRIKRLVRELEEWHRELLQSVREVRWISKR